MVNETGRKVIVIGHKNPDTDSICSAIAYARLKQAITGTEHIPCRAGMLNPETEYVLQKFNIPGAGAQGRCQNPDQGH